VFTSKIRRIVTGLAGVAMLAAFVAVPAESKVAQPQQATAAPISQLPSAIDTSASKSGPISAQAAEDGLCDVGDVCLYYYSNYGGSRYDTSHNDPSLFNNRFITSGSGQWAGVANNAESIWNRDSRVTLVICTGVNSTGTCGTVGPGVYGNLTATYKNNVESIYWADSSN
jgi:hypothetical protein